MTNEVRKLEKCEIMETKWRESGQILLNACEAQSTIEGWELPIVLDSVEITSILVKSRHLGIVKAKT